MDRDIEAQVRSEIERARTKEHPEAGAQNHALPASREREPIQNRGYRYQISPAEMDTMRQIGRFRTIPTEDLARFQYGGKTAEMSEDLGSLRAQGLIQQRTLWTGAKGEKLNLIVLTKTGREILEGQEGSGSTGRLYAGFVKAREVRHDAAIYRMYHAEAARIERAGGRIKRIVLDYELKQKIYKPLAKIRPKVTPAQYAKTQAEVAAQNGLKVVRGRILLPDLRIEYETGEGAVAFVDLELATRDYRGAHMRGKAEAGFKMYASQEAARGLAAAYDPEHMAEIFTF
jgi:hypothetical protein